MLAPMDEWKKMYKVRYKKPPTQERVDIVYGRVAGGYSRAMDQMQWCVFKWEKPK